MRIYLKKFNLHTNYETYINSSDKLLPNVSYCETEDEVHYNPYVYDYSKDYLTFEALENGSFTMTLDAKLPTTCVESVSYSIDNGETWVTTNNVDNEIVTITTPTIIQGNKVIWKGTAVLYCTNIDPYPGSNIGYGYFTSTNNFNISGNIMSLLYNDDFNNKITLPTLITTGPYAGIFSHIFGKENCKIISAIDLKLPAIALTNYCYYHMFYGCTSLTTAPELPATTLADYCYCGMFYGCTSLTIAPELPATTLALICYSSMFYGCTSLVSAPELPATTLVLSCYSSMFYGCTNLTTAPELPATTLALSCYSSMFRACTSLTITAELPATTLANECYILMFYGCTSLTTAPELPATTLVYSCYNGMFYGCTNLTTAPELPATTLALSCYNGMFQSCTSLTTAPELPATTLASNCYFYMFYGCTKLNYIKAMFTTTPPAAYTQNWVTGVASTGTFIKNSEATWNETGVNGIPTGWTVETASA